MRSIPFPAFDARETFEICANTLSDQELAARLLGVAPAISHAAQNYNVHGLGGSWYKIPTSTMVGMQVHATDMSRLYKNTLSRKNSRARRIYDSIKAAAPGGICPLCSQRDVSTLDHYLPKAHHPALSVTPLNLVPACSDCNKAKLDRQPGSPQEQTLHPYYDAIENDKWLSARVIQTAPATVQFQVTPPSFWAPVLQARVSHHFKTFMLAKLYATHAAVELGNIKFNLERIANTGGATNVRRHLLEEAEGRSARNKNSWQTALYEALASSEWFCAGGYLSIM